MVQILTLFKAFQYMFRSVADGWHCHHITVIRLSKKYPPTKNIAEPARGYIL